MTQTGATGKALLIASPFSGTPPVSCSPPLLFHPHPHPHSRVQIFAVTVPVKASLYPSLSQPFLLAVLAVFSFLTFLYFLMSMFLTVFLLKI